MSRRLAPRSYLAAAAGQSLAGVAGDAALPGCSACLRLHADTSFSNVMGQSCSAVAQSGDMRS